MRQRPLFWAIISVLCLLAAIYFWQLGERQIANRRAGSHNPAAASGSSATASPGAAGNASTAKPAAASKSRYPYRLANTDRKLKQLQNDDHAVLLLNALIDTTRPVNLAIPDRLRAPKNNGTYIVQSRGATDAAFRSTLRAAGASVVSYIPNNAWLVRVSDGGAQQLAANPQTQSVLPFEPYYKLDPSLLKAAMEHTDYSAGLVLTLFDDTKDATISALKQMGAEVTGEQRSPFGPVVQVNAPPNGFIDLARLPGVQLVSPSHARRAANDLMRPRLNLAIDSITSSNYNGLTGSNVLVDINDSGVDMTHPDLTGRIFGDFPSSLVDSNGHGTHVAGTILGSGVQSSTVAHAPEGSLTNASFRGMATNAQAYVVGIGMFPGPNANQTTFVPDAYLQEQAALTNALISNNSWNYYHDTEYDIFAASYDAAVRDALPAVSGPQPVLFVFSAGDDGGGQDDGTGGFADSIGSPASAKNVITVGALEQLRNITNNVVVDGNTNMAFLPATDSTNQVAGFSGRGNVGIEIEGTSGRFKPDLVAPGVFVVSDRSSMWDMNTYYNPTNYSFTTIAGQSVVTNQLDALSVGVPDNGAQLVITIVPNSLSPNPMPPLPIYVRQGDNPTFTAFDFLGTNQVSLPPDLPLNPPTTWFYSIGNNSTNETVNFDVLITLATTNDTGNTLTVLSNMNNSIGPWYRYESGTSMSAAGVSGMLACMQEFYQGRLHMTNSPALMKALLINGARSVSDQYGFSVTSPLNLQGWGLPSLPNSAPAALSGLANGGDATTYPVVFYDQSPTNALATGDSFTRIVTLSSGGQQQDLRFTLVWTDPPGNPASGMKLVNDLDLIITNLDTGDVNFGSVYYGNDIPFGGGNVYSEAWNTNNPPPTDSVNNVENVFLQGPVAGKYSVTVYGKRVNVNAVTGNTNDVVQDYALVISSGSGGAVSNAFASITPSTPTVVSNLAASIQAITNGIPVLNQRVGGNSQFSGSTNGEINQWNFYVYTNITSFTNVAFVTFAPPELGVPRMGVYQSGDPLNATRAEADVDLYVSPRPLLTNLNPVILAGALKSTTRTGTEKVLITNSTPGQVYYVGVKSEDQQGANYGFVAVATQFPFDQRNTNGDVSLTVLANFPLPIPDGTPSQPGKVTILALTTDPAQVRKVVVTNTVTHQRFGDLIGTLTHGSKFAVLNNHSSFVNPGDTTETFIYDDSGEGNDPLSVTSDGPGSLLNFVGDSAASGVWMFTMEDDAPSETGSELGFAVTVSPQTQTNNSVAFTLCGGQWFYDFITVPPGVTNMTLTLTTTGSNPLELYVKRGSDPTFTDYDKFAFMNPPGTNLSITTFESPPLNPGNYFVGVFNPAAAGAGCENGNLSWTFGFDVNGVQPVNFLSVGNEPILDDAVTYSTNHVGINSKVVSAEVGVRIDHPRESDLVLTLVSPSGTRVLLAENRGGLDTNGYGSGLNVTNYGPVVAGGRSAPSTNSIPVSIPSGVLQVGYQFLNAPSDMRVYYGATLIFDTGLVIGSSRFSVPFGTASASNLVITVNEPGTNPSTNGMRWSYTANVLSSEVTYATFTEDTNKTTLPIKFATPPFGTATASAFATLSDFETSALGNYTNPGPVDGWTILSNRVTVATAPPNANTGSNYLGLRNGSITRTLPTIAGDSYTLQFANRRAFPLDPIHWWPADTAYTAGIASQDIVEGNNGTLMNGAGLTLAGEVNQSFVLNGTSQYVEVAGSPSLDLGAETTGFTIDLWINPTTTARLQPLVEWNNPALGFSGAIGTHFWISLNTLGALTPGSVYANLIDTANVQHNFNSPPGLVLPNVWSHVALSYDKTTGLAKLYVNGVVAASANLGIFTPETAQDHTLYFGYRPPPGSAGPSYFGGGMDEIGFYDHPLTDAQIADIYDAGSLGRCGSQTPPSICPQPMANVFVDGNPAATLNPATNSWTTQTYFFIASANGTPVEIDWLGNPSGVLLDTFQFLVPGTSNLFFLPEESLDKIVGEPTAGDWKLEILDNRAGPPVTNPPALISWQLSLVSELVVPTATPLIHGVPVTNTVGTNSIVYFFVDVPPWAQYATNILTSSGPANLIFNQNFLPGTNASDVLLNLTAPPTPGGTVTLTTNVPSPNPTLLPGQRYFLAVTNTSALPETITMEVFFDITSLTNGIAYTNTLLPGSIPRYFQYDVTPAAQAVAFEILNPSGNVDLVARYGAPLPDELSHDYISANPGSNPESIIVLTNSVPRALAPGRWYLGVFNNDVVPVSSAIRATESGPPNIIVLTNGIPFNFSSTPGVALSNFFEFDITQTNSAALFELYNLTGNADLTLDQNVLPYSPPFFAQSFNPGTNREQIVIRTNILGTPINASWFLGVPDNDTNTVNYTIRAVVATNGMLISGVGIGLAEMLPPPGATNGPSLTWQSVLGENYEIQYSTDLINWITITNVFGGNLTTTFVDPTQVTGGSLRFYRIIQIPVP